MKPTKNRFYCRECGRKKMLFETEKKANTFIKFNSDEIEAESGYCPNRSYYCNFCNGWHVTSKKEWVDTGTETAVLVELHKPEKEKRAFVEVKIAETKKWRI